MAADQRFDLNLASLRGREVLTGTQGARVATVRCTRLDAPAQLHFGPGGSPWDIELGADYRPCPPETGGIYVTNAASGGTLTLMVTMAEGETPVTT